MTKRVELMLVQYANGERRVVEAREDEVDVHKACASEFLAANDTTSPLLDYDLSCDMSAAEMDQVRDLDGVTVIRREQFQGTER